MTRDSILQGLVEPVRLSAAQQKWLPTFSNDWRWQLPIGLPNKTRRALLGLGLVEQIHPAGGVGFIKYRLSPLGVAACEALRAKAQS